MNRIILILFVTSTAIAQGPPPPGGGGGGASGDGIWRRNAYYGELQTFDSCHGHQPQTGQYHYHVNPICLRAQLNDNVVTLRTGRTGAAYQEAASGWHHSPILGWAIDGYPIYGPYGYSTATDPTSPIKRIKSGFQLRNITTRTTLPAWSLPNHSGVSQNLTSSQYGPNVSLTFALGRYNEDFEWVSGLGDLDQYNGRFAVTPDFPNGTYAYYVTINDDGTPAFPYIFAGQFYGAATGSFPTSVTASTTDYFNGGVVTAGPTLAALTSWSTKYSNQKATVVSGYDPSAGPQTTWSGQTTAVNAEAQHIRYSTSSAYITVNALAGYPMGPWFSSDMTSGVFINFPQGLSTTFQMPLAPAQATTQASTAGGPQGLWVNGVYIFNFIDGASYINATGQDSQAGNTPALLAAIASAASYEQGPIAPGSLVLAAPLYFTSLPTSISGTTITVTDSAGATAIAPISYAAANQINFQMPKGLASGAASLTIVSAAGTIPSKFNIQPVYPNLFLLNVYALACANVIRVHNGVQTVEDVSNPIAFNGDQIFLVLYGSGLGNATSATATIGGVSATVAYAGPQPTYSGVDQYNIQIPSSLAGKGKVDVIVTAGGKASNPVNITIQ